MGKNILLTKKEMYHTFGVYFYLFDPNKMVEVNADVNLEKSTAQLSEMGVNVDSALIAAVIKGMGIANLGVDSSLVAATDQAELDRVEANFLEKKLGLTDEAANKAAIGEVASQMGQFKNKQRGAFYYLLAVKFGKESVYLG